MRECILWRLRNWQLIGDKSSARTWNWRLLSLSIIIKIAFESTWVCPIEKLIQFAFFFFFIILPYDRHEFFAQWIEHFMDLFSPSYDSITFNHFFLLSRSCRRHSSLFLRSIRHWNFASTKDFFKHILTAHKKMLSWMEQNSFNNAPLRVLMVLILWRFLYIHLKSMNCVIADKTNGINFDLKYETWDFEKVKVH